jgi:hypothetical protein
MISAAVGLRMPPCSDPLSMLSAVHVFTCFLLQAGETALHVAVELGHALAVEELLKIPQVKHAVDLHNRVGVCVCVCVCV